jgi:hypothetical protein
MLSKRKLASKPSRSSSGTGTFRLEMQLLDSLREEADHMRTSLNTLVSQILRSHTEYHTYAAKGGMISMPRSLLVTMMAKLDHQEVIKLSEYVAKNELKDTVMIMQGGYTPEAVMRFIESWARTGGFAFRHHVHEGDDKSKTKHSFMMQHDMGDRWSLYFIELFKFAFEQTGTRISFEQSANTLAFDVEF